MFLHILGGRLQIIWFTTISVAMAEYFFHVAEPKLHKHLSAMDFSRR